MIVKTEALAGPALDWAVAKAHWGDVESDYAKFFLAVGYNPSERWDVCGPLIEFYEIDLTHSIFGWSAITTLPRKPEEIDGELIDFLLMDGETPLIAACRALVAAKLGSEVDIPEELL